MKERRKKPDIKKGFQLLRRLIRLFPYALDTDENELGIVRSRSYANIVNNFWNNNIIQKLDQKGYSIQTSSNGIPKYSGNKGRLRTLILNISKGLIYFFNDIETESKHDIYEMNRSFMTLRWFFKLIFQSLTHDGKEWREVLIDNNNEFIESFWYLFGRSDSIIREKILTPNDFIKTINEILIELGFESFSITSDGFLRFFGTSVQAEEYKKTYNLLSVKGYNNVINELDLIDEHLRDKRYQDALSVCRRALESFYKRLLINHGITVINKGRNSGKKVDDGVLTDVAQEVKDNISQIFSFPQYSINLDSQGIPHLLESSKFMISGLANTGGSHGKSKPPKIKIEEIKAARSFLILLINTLLFYSKK